MGIVSAKDSHHQGSTEVRLCEVLLGGFTKNVLCEG